MTRFSPNITNVAEHVERGPSTRRLRQKITRTSSLYFLFSFFRGRTLVALANIFLRARGQSSIKLSYHQESKLYSSHESETHYFSDSKRIWTVFHGQLYRGKQLCYEYFLDQISFCEGDSIIDVGANAGDLLLAFRALQVNVNFFSFEPSAGEFDALRNNLRKCSSVLGHSAYQVALWKENIEQITFYLKTGTGDSSVLPIHDATKTVTVRAVRLDSILPPNELRYRLLKLEAEGAEYEVLVGAQKLLPQIDYIVADVGFERGLSCASTLPDVTNFLLANGFKICAFQTGRLVVLFENTTRKT